MSFAGPNRSIDSFPTSKAGYLMRDYLFQFWNKSPNNAPLVTDKSCQANNYEIRLLVWKSDNTQGHHLSLRSLLIRGMGKYFVSRVAQSERNTERKER